MSRYPEISPDHCVHGRIRNASCQSCVDACPQDAWILGEDALGLDEDACDGCGLCIPACPTGALYDHFPYVIRLVGGQAVALFGCERSGAQDTEAALPCVHSLGVRQLLLLYTSGVSHLLLTRDDCGSCPDCPGETLEQRVERLNLLLGERHRPLLKLSNRPVRVWKAVLNKEALITRGTRLNRRAFLSGVSSSQILQEQLVSMDPLNRPESRTIAPGMLLDSKSRHAHLPWVPHIEAAACSGCDACIQLCPTEALRHETQHEDSSRDGSSSCYRMDAPRCTGCGICVDVCSEQAIRLEAWGTWEENPLPLGDAVCHRCGNSYHVPVDSKLNADGLCPICRSTGSKRLFQVLGAA
ncbi:MAG TPA: 4Fe-4S dicluster domain-containing protein [Thiolapillus brandeum]|uniref:4Fe-4S dicluster domain-containing protein n=1 Tax=Thiolapillus brandeum TaxID=1076588 RepID=A0A831RSQ8_9GAMM|nr:4Fe-4S dicluster domain-containing protein [Thiolapillus brandeum]